MHCPHPTLSPEQLASLWGDLVRAYRAERNASHAEFATFVGIRPSELRAIEAGRGNMRALAAVAQYCMCDRKIADGMAGLEAMRAMAPESMGSRLPTR